MGGPAQIRRGIPAVHVCKGESGSGNEDPSCSENRASATGDILYTAGLCSSFISAAPAAGAMSKLAGAIVQKFRSSIVQKFTDAKFISPKFN